MRLIGAGRAGARAGLPARPRAHGVRQAAGQPRRQPRAHRRRPDRDRPGPAAGAGRRLEARRGRPAERAVARSPQIKVAVPNMAQRGHRHGDAAARRRRACPTTSRSRRPGSARGRCGWPTGPTRCTAAWSPGSSSGKYRSPECAPCTAARVLVTGAASGLGAALTAAFRARGDEVLATDRGRRRSTCGSTSPPTTTGPPRSRTSRRHWGGLDVLVNNAGVAGGGRLDVAGLDEWRWITEINLFGVVRGTPHVRADAQAPALRPDRQRRLAGRAGAPGRDGVATTR